MSWIVTTNNSMRSGLSTSSLLTARAVLTALLIGCTSGAVTAVYGQSRGPAPLAPVLLAPVPFTFPAERTVRLAGAGSHWKTGAAVGLVAGTAAAVVVLRSGGSNSLCNRSRNQDALSTSECLGLYALGGVAGAAIGALIGSRFRNHGVQEQRRYFQVVPSRAGGLELGMVTRF